MTFQQELDTIDTRYFTITDQSYLDDSYLTELQVPEIRPLNPQVGNILSRVKAAGVLVTSRDVTRRRIVVGGGFAVDFVTTTPPEPPSRLPAGLPAGTQLALSDEDSYVVAAENEPVDTG